MEKNIEYISKYKIGIYGVGVVGGALRTYFENKNTKLFLYDTHKNLGSKEEINKADTIFLCLPTPYLEGRKGFDLSYIDNACNTIRGEKVLIIKSTVLPGTTEKLQERYPQHKFLFNPEFLSEDTAVEDTEKPDRQLIGYTQKSKDIAQDIISILPRAPYEKIMLASEAEMVKYFNNTFYAIEVVFANQIYELCKAVGIDYDNVMKSASASKFIKSKSHFTVWHKGYRGYGGKCLPKDIKSLIQFGDSLNIDLKLHKIAEELNNRLQKREKI